MPLKLVPPRPGKTPFYSVRGTHLRVYVDRSTGLSDGKKAQKFLAKIRDDIERGEFTAAAGPTFASAAKAYMLADGERRFIAPLLGHFRDLPLSKIDQAAIDAAALAIYPNAGPATRNRQVHTVVSTILKHAGIERQIRRPKGSQGRTRMEWLTTEQAFALFERAEEIDAEFGAFVLTITYTGLRLGEATRLEVDKLNLSGGFAYVPKTKNGEPRGVHLPPVVVAALANHPRGLDRKGERVFRFHKGSRLYGWLDEALASAGIVLPPRSGFHVLRHTWATWLRQFAGLDTRALVGTGAWNDLASASRYAHVVATDEAKKADMLPVPGRATRGKSVESGISADNVKAADAV